MVGLHLGYSCPHLTPMMDSIFLTYHCIQGRLVPMLARCGKLQDKLRKVGC